MMPRRAGQLNGRITAVASDCTSLQPCLPAVASRAPAPHSLSLPALPCSAQLGLWVFVSASGRSERLGQQVTGCFLAVVSAGAAAGFVLYGGRLFLMLRRFPIESRGRRKKLREVGLVTTICATCFLLR